MPDELADDGCLAALKRAQPSLSGVQAAFLFGSRASGCATTASDIDVALLLERAPLPEERSAVLRAAIEALGQELRTDRLDLVILNDAPPKLAFQILKYGKLAFERDAIALHRFRVATYRRHSDYELTERFFRQVTKSRAQRGVARG